MISQFVPLLLIFLLVWALAITAYVLYLTKSIPNSRMRRRFPQEENVGGRLAKLEEQFKLFYAESSTFVNHIGVVRFNPFKDIGGQQSFAIALLDKTGTGVVLSALHSRAATRIYAKPISKGKSLGNELSNEEQKALTLAIENRS